tara:strand:+ start:4901 stop:6778 length:1878 start_codon:yes stop_codon:yes gene_type:complete
MAYKLTKKYPENFSNDITEIVNILALKHGEKPFLYGSGSLKIENPSDYDLAQDVPVNKFILSDLQDVIKKLLKRKDIYIGDIKSGEIPELKVIPDDISHHNYNSYREEMINKLKQLCKNNNITSEEYKESIKLLQPNLKEIDIYIIKHDIRYEVIRWKPEDILKGFVNYRNIKINFNTYLLGDTITKIDVIAWINGIRYNEITMVYSFSKNGIMINKKFGNIELALLDQIPYLLHKGMYMKICKRINSIERATKNPNILLLRKLYSLFTSDLGLLNQVISDISVLEYLIENIKYFSKQRFEYEIDQMKSRLGNMTNLKYLKKQNVVIELLNELGKDTVDLSLIEKLKDVLFNILQSETLKKMKKYKLYPIPDDYLPHTRQIEGGKLKVKHLKEILSASYSKTPPQEIDDFILDKQLSNTYAKVYHNPKTGQTIIAHKGTQGLLDWGNNIVYGLFGKTGYKLTGRFKNAKKVQDATEAKYGTKELTTVGHSQGGLNAEILGQKSKEVITLNKATRPFANKKGEKQHDISTTGDLVSKLNPFQNKSKKDISIKSKSYNPIKEHVLPVLEGLDEENEIGEGNKKKRICMKRKDIIKEHKKLIPILKRGNKKERIQEALDQQKELNNYL